MRDDEPLLAVSDLKVYFSLRQKGSMPWSAPGILKAVDGVDFELAVGETLGVVGESGCGKSTLARALIRMLPAKSGRALWLGQDIFGLTKLEFRSYRKQIQMIYQDPLASLNPRMTVGQIISEPLRVHFPDLSQLEMRDSLSEVMEKVGLLPNFINRYPHEFSGGQCQRIAIARAIIMKPKLIICDEPVSALDVSIQAQVINLLMELQKDLGLSLIFIAHDLSVVKHISSRILVLYLGNVMELADRDSLYAKPRHPYTKALISAVPVPDPKIERHKKFIQIEGDLPSPLNPPPGCVFNTRCPKVGEICHREKPPLAQIAEGHKVACHFPD